MAPTDGRCPSRLWAYHTTSAEDVHGPKHRYYTSCQKDQAGTSQKTPHAYTSLEKLGKKKGLTCCLQLIVREARSPNSQTQIRPTCKHLKFSGSNKTLWSNWDAGEISFTVITKAKRYGNKSDIQVLMEKITKHYRRTLKKTQIKGEIYHILRWWLSISKSVFTKLLLKLNIIPIEVSVAFVWVCGSVEFYKLILKFTWKGKKEKNSPKILGTRLKTYLEKLALSKLILKPYWFSQSGTDTAIGTDQTK